MFDAFAWDGVSAAASSWLVDMSVVLVYVAGIGLALVIGALVVGFVSGRSSSGEYPSSSGYDVP